MSYPEENESNTEVRRFVIAAVVLVLLVGAAWWWLHRPKESLGESVADVPVQADPVAMTEPQAIQHPLEPVEQAPADATDAPPVDADTLAAGELRDVFDGKLSEWLMPDKLMRRLVATVDNLTHNARVEPLRPLRAPSAPFAVEREVVDAAAGTERITISPANAARYDAIVGLLASVDTAKAVAAYRRIYPQLQQGYEDLGYPGRYFNDRVVQVIDHLLETPEPEGPILLEQPKVLYRFADADLESRSAGQKLLLRIGVDHERTVKKKLREIRALIAGKE
jgi:hypothetical protein